MLSGPTAYTNIRGYLVPKPQLGYPKPYRVKGGRIYLCIDYDVFCQEYKLGWYRWGGYAEPSPAEELPYLSRIREVYLPHFKMVLNMSSVEIGGVYSPARVIYLKLGEYSHRSPESAIILSYSPECQAIST